MTFNLLKMPVVNDFLKKVLKKSQEWGDDENMMYVVGATQVQCLKYASMHPITSYSFLVSEHKEEIYKKFANTE